MPGIGHVCRSEASNVSGNEPWDLMLRATENYGHFCSLVIVLLRYNSHTIHSHLHPLTIQFIVFSIFTKLGNHHHYLIPEYFHHPQKKPHTNEESLPIPPILQPLTTINLLFASISLPILDISYKWNHTVCGLLSLASFT